MLRLFALAALLVAVVNPVAAQPADRDTSMAVIDSVYAIIKERSLHRDAVDWNETDRTFRAAVDSADTFADALQAFRGVFAAMEDVHSAMYYRGQWIGYRPESLSRPVRRDVSALIAEGREQANQPSGMILRGDIAYVLVPPYGVQGAEAIGEAAAKLRDLVYDLASQSPRGWVLDLRVNEGGNIHPMLSGLGDLLGDGLVMRSVHASGDTQFTWSIDEGVLTVDGYQAASVDRRCPDARGDGRVAVPVGPATASSGQIAAIAFAGWEPARLFGDPTADGYATSNGWNQITPDLALNLSVAYFADRSGFVHEGIVLLNEEVDDEWDLDRPEADPVVQRARDWITSR
ncbi:MAG: S41 family peptidase [Bacteroidota bacterium]